MSAHLARLFLVASALTTACSTMPMLVRDHSSPISRPHDTFKVLTYNALHGLEVGQFWVRPGESPEERGARFQLRVEQLAEVQPDVILLQEVNPLPEMAEDYVHALAAQGSQYSEVHQVDACGVRVPGLALLPGLNNGLVILATAPVQLRTLEGTKLSGGFGGCQDTFGVQFGELRYALIAEVQRPASAMKHIVVSTHLHSGFERDAALLHDPMAAQAQGHIMRYDQLMAELKQDQERRLSELRTIAELLQPYQASGEYAGIIIGGDFNFKPDAPEYTEAQRLGFQDSAHLDPQMAMLKIYDPIKQSPRQARRGQTPRRIGVGDFGGDSTGPAGNCRPISADSQTTPTHRLPVLHGLPAKYMHYAAPFRGAHGARRHWF
jgi:endonuclease/exonuclease/phosphatase family metal-dependent hydrolase